MALSKTSQADLLLQPFVPESSKITGKDITVDRMKDLMRLIGDPQKRLKIIHVAGTSGKTSTSYYIAKMLQLSGFKVGLTVSPHIDKVTERVQINLNSIQESEFISKLKPLIKLFEVNYLKPTYFELLIAFAYKFFADQKVDYAVIETGMGGLHDGTNIADNADKFCVITDIGIDHTNILGTTIKEIAAQKAGIIRAGNSALMYSQSETVDEVIFKQCEKVGARLHVIDESEAIKNNFLPTIEDLPKFQLRNWLLAKEAIKLLASRDGFEIKDAKLAETVELGVPARMEESVVDDRKIIMDGAHNEQKMKVFVDSLAQKYKNKKFTVLIAMKNGKDYEGVLKLLAPISDTLIATEYASGQDMPIKALPADQLAEVARKLGFSKILVEPEASKAYGLLIENIREIGLITGSFFLIGQLRAEHKELINA